MGVVFDVKMFGEAAAGGAMVLTPGQIVTGRNYEYTILADVSSQAGESPIQVREEFYTIPAVSFGPAEFLVEG